MREILAIAGAFIVLNEVAKGTNVGDQAVTDLMSIPQYPTDAIPDDDTIVLGIDRNNPGNIKKDKKGKWKNWAGIAAVQDDPIFAIFDSQFWGIRAMARTVYTYSHRYGLNTPEQIIYRWAPPSDNNNTENYIAYIKQHMRVERNEPVMINNPGELARLVRCMIGFENGNEYYGYFSDSLLYNACSAAYKEM